MLAPAAESGRTLGPRDLHLDLPLGSFAGLHCWAPLLASLAGLHCSAPQVWQQLQVGGDLLVKPERSRRRGARIAPRPLESDP